jgi:hypothetical protein
MVVSAGQQQANTKRNIAMIVVLIGPRKAPVISFSQEPDPRAPLEAFERLLAGEEHVWLEQWERT